MGATGALNPMWVVVIEEFWRYSLPLPISLVILAGVRGFTLEGCTWRMECPGSGSDGYDGYDMTSVWWWIL